MKEKLLLNIEKADSGCWIWKGSKMRSGYGYVYLSRKLGEHGIGAHRASYLLFKGEIPKGLYVCHSCDNKLCINPDHLFLATQKENMADCAKKGRLCRGNRMTEALHKSDKFLNRSYENYQGSPHLSENQVKEVRRLHSEGINIRDLSEQFKIQRKAIYNIIVGNTWRQVH